MEDMAVKANEEYNNFSDNLSLEECKQLADVSYLLRTVVHFIESCGELKYQSHENYGFAETVEYLHLKCEEAEYFVQNLNADAIDDSFEIAKILLVLIYLARMECSTKVKELFPTKEIHRVALANMLSYLDVEIHRLNNEVEDEEYSRDAEEFNLTDQYSKLWEECLKRVAPILSVSELDTNEMRSPMTTKVQCWKSLTDIDVYIDNISNSSSPANTAINEPRIMGKHGAIRPLQRASPLFETAAFTPTRSLKRRSGGVTRVARRSEVLQNEKRIADLKSELKNLGADFDALQDQHAQLSNQLNQYMDERRTLQEKCNHLSHENGENLAILEEAQNEILHLQRDIARLTGADGKTPAIPAFAENEKLKRGKRRVDELLRGVMKESDEAKLMLGKAERQLIETVRVMQKLESEKKALQARIGELEQLVSSEKQSHQREIEQKDFEVFAKLQSYAEIQENYLRRINQLENEVLLQKQNQYLSHRRGPIIINKNSNLKMLEAADGQGHSTFDAQFNQRCGAGGDAMEPIIEEPVDTSLNCSALSDGGVRIEVAEEVDEYIEPVSMPKVDEAPKKKRGIGSKLICGGIFMLSMTMAVLFGVYAFFLTADKVYKSTKNSTEDVLHKKSN